MWAIVPIKTFDRAKQRLAKVLSDDERRSLMLAMARDVITSLSRSSDLTGILIVSRAAEADALAQAFATERFAESPGGSLADALDQATHHLIANFAAEGVFVVPADVPGIETSEVDSLISQNDSITILPDTDHIGTNGLICSPPLAMPYVFDGKSFKPHVDGAFERGITPIVVPGSSFALDVDTPSDLRQMYAESPESQTGIYLTKSGIASRLANLARNISG